MFRAVVSTALQTSARLRRPSCGLLVVQRHQTVSKTLLLYAQLVSVLWQQRRKYNAG